MSKVDSCFYSDRSTSWNILAQKHEMDRRWQGGIQRLSWECAACHRLMVRTDFNMIKNLSGKYTYTVG